MTAVDLLFPEETALVRHGRCPWCKEGVDPKGFRDELSRKEFRISGLCQGCQDSFFDAKADGLEDEGEEVSRAG